MNELPVNLDDFRRLAVAWENDADEPLARFCYQTVSEAYPDWPWCVDIKGGIIQITIVDVSKKWGMALHQSKVDNDAKVLKQSIIRAAGEFLERAGARRGRREALWTPGAIEGIPRNQVGHA